MSQTLEVLGILTWWSKVHKWPTQQPSLKLWLRYILLLELLGQPEVAAMVVTHVVGAAHHKLTLRLVAAGEYSSPQWGGRGHTGPHCPHPKGVGHHWPMGAGLDI